MNIRIKALTVSLCLIGFTNLCTAQRSELNLFKIFKGGNFKSKNIANLRSMKNGINYTASKTENKDYQIIQYSYQNPNESKVVFKASDLSAANQARFKSIDEYTFSADESKLILMCDFQQVYRHSGIANYFVYDLKSKTLIAVDEAGKQSNARLSSDNQHIAYVKDFNVYVKDLNTNTSKQLTKDGKHDFIHNGMLDWVYEEEFSFEEAFQWSDNGKYLVFYRFKQDSVPQFDIPYYRKKLYPETYTYRYPKAGETNALVNLVIYNQEKNTSDTLNLKENPDSYIARFKWIGNNLMVAWLNRQQNKLKLYLKNPENGSLKVMYEESNPKYVSLITDNTNYHDIFSDIIMLENEKGFIMPSERSGFMHLHQFDMNGKWVKAITSGEWEMNGVLAVDYAQKQLFYSSTENGPYTRTLHRVNFDGSKRVVLGSTYGFSIPNFSSNGAYYINAFSSINEPPVYSLYDRNGKELRILEDNKALKDSLKKYEFQRKNFTQIKLNDGTLLNASVLKPFPYDSTKKYPVIMSVYGGPGSLHAADRWEASNSMFHQYLSKKGYWVIAVDNRGTGGRGEAFCKTTYLKLGAIETADQIEAAQKIGRWIGVDSTRIGITGGSYGGYMSLLAITKGANVFKTAVAVSPVTNWRYYDNIYTERYMGLPKDNGTSYDENSPLAHVDKLKGNLLLIHGTGDDNVHFQNSIEIIRELQAKNKTFDLMIYPDAYHSVGRSAGGYHYYELVAKYFVEKL